MTNPDCQKRNRHGDCLTRNCRVLCDVCDSLLSDDERKHREIGFLRLKLQRLGAGASGICKRQRKYGKSCLKLFLCAPCPACCASMNPRQLTRYATRLYERGEEMRQYWDDYSEAEEYSKELRAQGVAGIEWNIEMTDVTDLRERNYIISGLFFYGKPCFIHANGEGLLKPEIGENKP